MWNQEWHGKVISKGIESNKMINSQIQKHLKSLRLPSFCSCKLCYLSPIDFVTLSCLSISAVYCLWLCRVPKIWAHFVFLLWHSNAKHWTQLEPQPPTAICSITSRNWGRKIKRGPQQTVLWKIPADSCNAVKTVKMYHASCDSLFSFPMLMHVPL